MGSSPELHFAWTPFTPDSVTFQAIACVNCLQRMPATRRASRIRPAELTAAAVDAARQWRYRPGAPRRNTSHSTIQFLLRVVGVTSRLHSLTPDSRRRLLKTRIRRASGEEFKNRLLGPTNN